MPPSKRPCPCPWCGCRPCESPSACLRQARMEEDPPVYADNHEALFEETDIERSLKYGER